MSDEKLIRDNSGYWVENVKTKETQPDYKGKVRLKGVEYYIAIWENENGVKSFSLTPVEEFKKKNASKNENTTSNVQEATTEKNDDLFGDLFSN